MATTRDRWQKIEVLYHSALDRDPSARAAFLDGACGNDDELRREVESLLAETSTGQGLLDRPAEALLAESATIELKPGARLGPYQIEGLIGEGGMGTVYKARDTRLGRTVAIKTSSVRFSERFEREARAAAALNHPHICQLYDVGSDYLVMEYIEGENLKGPLPLDQTLKIAGQIADALEAAHEKGIVHRDLKPANVKIKPDGQVKVLDFGLASAGAEPELTPDSPTMMPGTQMGVILGTAGYMSHEQARRHLGLRRGALRDCHGKRLFDGATVSDSLAAILTKEPDLTMVPGKIRRLLQACLEKDSKNRLRDVADWARLLDVGHAFPTATMRKLPWIVSGVLALFLAGLGFVHFCQKPPETPILRYSIEPPEKTSFGPTPPALSPDGRKLVFSAQSADGKTQLWVRPLDSLTAQPLAGTDNGRAPFWSPDSKSIGFFANGKLMRAELAGGQVLTLADALTARGGSWNADGVIVFTSGTFGPLRRVPASGGAVTTVTKLESAKENSHRWPWFLPDGRHFLFLSVINGTGHGSIRAGSLDSPEIQTLTDADSEAIYAQGRLLFLRGSTLVAQPFDAKTLELTGEAAHRR